MVNFFHPAHARRVRWRDFAWLNPLNMISSLLWVNALKWLCASNPYEACNRRISIWMENRRVRLDATMLALNVFTDHCNNISMFSSRDFNPGSIADGLRAPMDCFRRQHDKIKMTLSSNQWLIVPPSPSMAHAAMETIRNNGPAFRAIYFCSRENRKENLNCWNRKASLKTLFWALLFATWKPALTFRFFVLTQKGKR